MSEQVGGWEREGWLWKRELWLDVGLGFWTDVDWIYVGYTLSSCQG